MTRPRGLTLVSLLVVAGCGGTHARPAATPSPTPTVVKAKQAEKARIEASSLPKDAKKELEKARAMLNSP